MYSTTNMQKRGRKRVFSWQTDGIWNGFWIALHMWSQIKDIFQNTVLSHYISEKNTYQTNFLYKCHAYHYLHPKHPINVIQSSPLNAVNWFHEMSSNSDTSVNESNIKIWFAFIVGPIILLIFFKNLHNLIKTVSIDKTALPHYQND
jgi:hypothetical protein